MVIVVITHLVEKGGSREMVDPIEEDWWKPGCRKQISQCR